ncbi:MAG: hypothetical protein ABI923_12350 [bacterium]
MTRYGFSHVPDDPSNTGYRPRAIQCGDAREMSKVHFLIGNTSTDAVNGDLPVLLLLPETICPAAVPTYSGQLYEGAAVLVRLGSFKNIFTNHFLPHMGAVDKDTLAASKRELDALQAQLYQFSGDTSKRASVFVNYLSTHQLIDRKLYPVVGKLRRKAALTNKELTPFIDAIYTNLRKTAGATSAHKDKIRDYIQSGAYDRSLTDWLTRFVDPNFGWFNKASRLIKEVEELESRSRLTDDPALARDLCTAVEELAAGISSGREIHGVKVEPWLEEIVGCKCQASFFAEILEVREGLTKTGCLRLESLKNVNDLKELGPKFIPLDKFSCIVTALDRALSVIVMEYAHADPDMLRLFDGYEMHSGLLMRAFLGDTNAIRTMYPKHVVGIPGKTELDETLVSQARHAFENGLMAQLCSKHFGLEEHALKIGLQKAVSIQKKLLPLLPAEIHHFVDVLETRIRIRKMVEKLQASDRQAVNQVQLRNLRANLNAQNSRGQQISKRLKADFRIDLSKMFCLDVALMDEIEELFGSGLGILRTVLARYIENCKAEANLASAVDEDHVATNG